MASKEPLLALERAQSLDTPRSGSGDLRRSASLVVAGGFSVAAAGVDAGAAGQGGAPALTRAAGKAGGVQDAEDGAQGRDEAKAAVLLDPGFGINLLVALFSVFQGATDGLSLGSLIFPHSADHPNNDYKSLGMSIGLLTAFVSNFISCFTSQFPHAVGGAVMPVIPIMAGYFGKLGPENCPTIMVAMPLMTALCGVLTYAMGKIGVQDIVKACPFVVFGGFIAGTGAQLLEFALNMMYPNFVSFSSVGSDGLGAFLEKDFWMFCGPGILFALVVFLVPRLNPSGSHTFLLPAGVVVLAAAFYTTLLATGTSVEDARAQGWLFDVQVPQTLDFYRVWTKQEFSAVRWDLILTREFLLTTLQVFLMGFLTTTKNIYGTAEFTHCVIDIDKEICGAGIQGIFCGVAGGMPGNIVMSFAITAHSLGVRTRRFSALLALLSLAFFIVGDFIIAFIPKMVPAGMLFWLGIILVIAWIWDMVGSMSATEHAIVILMIVVDIVLDPATMILLGLFLTLIVSIRRMMAMAFITNQYTLFEVRSDVLRTGDQASIMAQHAKEVMILRLARGYFSFANASSVVDRVQEAIARAASAESPRLRVLILDFEDVLGMDTTALNALSELHANAQRSDFLLVLSGCQPEVAASVRRFGIATNPEMDQYDDLLEHAVCMGERTLSCAEHNIVESWGRQVVIVPACDASELCPAATIVALELSERLLISAYQPASAEPTFPARRRTAMGADVKNPSLLAVRQFLVSDVGIDASIAAMALLVDIHCWLNEYMSTYKPQALFALGEVFEVRSYLAGEVIYEFTPEAFPEWQVSSSGPGEHVPPLLWLLGGEVKHFWNGHILPFSHFRGIEQSHNLQANQRLEKAELPYDNVHYCVGPFQTELGFKGAMMHPGRLVATQPSRCVALQRSKYDALARSSPEALEALSTYLARKRFVMTSIAKACGPRLFL